MEKIKVEDIKENMILLINGQKCKVKKFEKSNIGKHGKIKCRKCNTSELRVKRKK